MPELVFILTASFGVVWCLFVIGLAVGLQRLKPAEGASSPSVSVLVAARNEEKDIGRCLDALSKQNYPLELLEIIVIDDDSTDRTTEIVLSFSAQHPNIRLLKSGAAADIAVNRRGITAEPEGAVNQGRLTADLYLAPKKRALLTGIAFSQSEIILATDADCVPPHGWVRRIARQFEPEVAAVVGYSPIMQNVECRMQNAECGVQDDKDLEQRSFLARMFANLTSTTAHFDAFVNGIIAAGTIGLGVPTTAAGRNFAYRRKSFLTVQGFGASGAGASGDDDLLLQRLAIYTGKILFSTDPATFVPAAAPSSLTAWWRMKRRHLSAGRRYSSEMIVVSTLLYSFNLGLTICFILSLIGYLGWLNLSLLWAVKILIDGWTIKRGAAILTEPRWFVSWLAAELISPILFTMLVPFALVGKVHWKGRILKK
ncbi:MAG: glycosyltransferase [Calditrichaeota bacterium]|nr:glycosyltransferase [Calditrichota bacterium]